MKLQSVSNLKDDVNVALNDLDALIKDRCKKIKKEAKDEMESLIKKIAEGEGLNYEDLKIKYLDTKKETKIKPINTEALLDIIEIDGKQFYYQNVNNGIVLDESNTKVGIFKNGQFVFN